MPKATFILSTVLLLLAGAFCCACQSDEGGNAAQGSLPVRVSVPGWAMAQALATQSDTQAPEPSATRAGGAMLYPINLLIVPLGSDQPLKRATVVSGTEFAVTIPDGTYAIHAVCGLSQELMPTQLSNQIAIPKGTDFAAGQVQVTVTNGVCTPATVSITAARQMACLDVTVTGIPTDIASFNLYIKGIADSYTLNAGWQTSAAARNRLTPITLSRSTNMATANVTLPPCAASGTTFVAEATTTAGRTVMLTYTSNQALPAGTRLMQTLSYADMTVVEGNLSLGDWADVTEGGQLTPYGNLQQGDQFLSYPATVIGFSASTNSVHLLGHRPIRATMAEVRSWDFKHLPYPVTDILSVQRWAFPTSATSAENVLAAINRIGWTAFDAQFASNGLEPIDRTSLRVLAYKDKNTDTFYVYDFTAGAYCALYDESGEFLIYPLGIVQQALH